MDDVQQSLRQARERLAAFEEEMSRQNLITRLKTSSPGHPLLLARVGAALAGFGLVLVATLVLAAPVLGREAAVAVHQVDAALGFPLPIALGVLAMCAMAMAAAAHQLALGAARNAPFLPDEAKQHQRLVADVKQLESRLALEGTPRPAVRVTSR